MPQTPKGADIAKDDLIVVLVGLTASWKKRRHARRHFEQSFGTRAYLPWIPYPLGLGISAAWLSALLRRRIAAGGHRRVHFVLYIGGGVLLRALHARGQRWPVGRTVWDRGPPQEQVARRLSARVPAWLLTLIGYRSIVDLARVNPADLSFPASPLGAGLIVETKSSVLARKLGIEDFARDLSAKVMRSLLPEATAAITVQLSHDEVYEDPRFLDQATAFIATGAFLDQPNEATG